MSAGDHLVDDDDANATKLIKTSKVVHGSDKKKCFYLFILSIFYYLFQFRARAQMNQNKINTQSHIKDTCLYERPLLNLVTLPDMCLVEISCVILILK